METEEILRHLIKRFEKLEKEVKKLRRSNVALARAYAEELGVLIYKEDEKDPLDAIFVTSHNID